MLSRLRIDAFTLAIFAAVLVASLAPVSGSVKTALEALLKVAIALMFFMHGAKLSRAAVIAGLTHWRLHLVILAATYLLFPLLGLGMIRAVPGLPEGLMAGIIYLSILPSTVQSSIAFTAMGRGNVAAAVCAASASNFIGVFLTPLLAALLMTTSGVTISFDAVKAIMLQLLLPFVLGQILQPFVGGFVKRHGKVLGLFDRGSILMVVFLAFSDAVVGGLWQRLTPATLTLLVVLMAGLLAVVLVVTWLAARGFGFDRADEVTIVMCGSKKTLASGVPMANILFAGLDIGMIVLPLMIFHQIQLMVCAIIAQRYGATAPDAAAE